MRPADKEIETLIQNLNDHTRPELDRTILDNCFAELKNPKISVPPSRPNRWRIIMRKPITKYAAAIIIIAGIIVINLFNSTPAWAIEQTIEAFENVNSVYIEGFIHDKDTVINLKMWARRGSHGKFLFGDYREENAETGHTIVVDESNNQSYIYNPTAKTVHIHEGLNVTIGNFLDKDYFLHLQQEMEIVELEYTEDRITEKEVVIFKWKMPIPSKYDKSIAKSGIITFDLETKLPIRWTSWNNYDFKGKPYSEWTYFEYNPALPENIFVFEIPEDATVIRE